MQRIYFYSGSPEKYVAEKAHLQVESEGSCANCGAVGPLNGHGTYTRGITDSLGQIVLMLIARFLCLLCGRTVSFLPDFAMSYRAVQAATFQAFLDGIYGRRDVERWNDVLRQYRRRMLAYSSEVLRVIGGGFGRGPPAPAALWPYLKEAYGNLAAATRQLVTLSKITIFKRYQCHQPATAV